LLFAVLCGFWFGSEALMQRLEEKLEKTETIDYRLIHIERGLAMFQENPLFGVGINRYGEEAEQYSFFQTELTEHAHNTWVTILAELGLAGFLSYLIPFGFVLFKSVKDYCRFPERRAILGIIVGLTLAFVAMSISIELRGALYSNALLFTLWAMTLGKTQKQAVAYGRVPRSNLTPIKARMFEGRFSEVARPHVRWP
jgi:O-antigen ligase